MTLTSQSIDQLAVATVRTLSIDAVQKANSGHPGMPMGAAPMGYTLYAKVMKHNPANPEWIDRDRFVLSAGHGSMLLYSLLHLSGYDLSLDELKNFRQWGSLTPGHPEYGHTPGVDATTGPLGQGFAMAVGMAMAEAHMAATYNRDGFKLIDHHTFVICGDGDLMEGISSEAASLAGHLKLGKLIVLYDSNDISLDGELSLSFSEKVKSRFEGYGWQYLRVDDGNDIPAIEAAIAEAKKDGQRPTLIEVKTIIGYGSPNKAGKGGHAGPHGSPLGVEEVALTKRAYSWAEDLHFHVPEEVKAHFAKVKAAGEKANAEWNELFAKYEQAYPELAKQFKQAVAGELPEGWDADLPVYSPADKGIGTRNASGNAINAFASKIPFFIGGSADLESSTMTHMKGIARFSPEDYSGRNVYFGVREFAMAAALNGMALHKGVKVYGGTFFVFSDYLRPAVRLSALQNLPVTYVLTHDSIGVGEDGPTHEPIEQLAALRVIPNVTVIRPADANETTQAWRYALENKEGPVALVLTRQAVPNLESTAELAREGVARGAYVVSDAPNPQVQLLATGSEVSLAIEAQKKLAEEGIAARVISMPSWELFEKQDKAYRDSVILPHVKARLAIEMAHPMGWHKYVGDHGDVLAIDKFGASAPASVIIKEYGFTVENVVAKAKALL
ncbi:transketolase [Paenibacillus thermoaerophilus]|uniref:Transketolase n=1 Tax=Paenibacillus thermoaerophilus TaxID=1215385 RepID=A0ABW2UZA4_9BACL|nr:transketolase [Paenibacillus thermoaerophilus]TMV17431.1 transketolase [Paenibacillus thermoaerophilus]